jgi:hypothetical protein
VPFSIAYRLFNGVSDPIDRIFLERFRKFFRKQGREWPNILFVELED